MKKLLCKVLLGKRKKIDFDARSIQRLLIIRNDKIGDMIVSTPLFRELKKKYPHLMIDVVASTANADIALYNPHINKIIIWDKKGVMNDIKKIREIRKEQYDVIFNPMGIFSLPFLMRIKLLKAKYLIGFNIAKYHTNTKYLGMFDYTVECDRKRPILDSYFSALQHFGLDDIDPRYELFGVDQFTDKAEHFLWPIKKQYARVFCFNYRGSSVTRTINKSDAISFCQNLSQAFPDTAIVIVYPPRDTLLAGEIAAATGKSNVFLSFETTSILEVAALIRRCDAVISPDTSIIHIASAYNKKILGFYINTDNYKWFYPASEQYRVIISDHEAIGLIDAAGAVSTLREILHDDESPRKQAATVALL